jgi:hypothetical protein
MVNEIIQWMKINTDGWISSIINKNEWWCMWMMILAMMLLMIFMNYFWWIILKRCFVNELVEFCNVVKVCSEKKEYFAKRFLFKNNSLPKKE